MIKEIKKEIIEYIRKEGIELKFSQTFDKQLKKLQDNNKKIKLYKKILKIIKNPSIGKHLKYARKGQQEVYLDYFRLYYKNYKEEKTIRFTEFSHKDEQ